MVSSLLFTTLLLGAAEATSLVPRQSSCPKVHIIVARASQEAPGPGIIGAVADQVAAANNDTTIEAITYPATLANYGSSSAQGTAAMVTSLQNIVNNCSDTQVVLMGYSQGAQVVGDTVCGGGGIALEGSTVNSVIDSKYSDRVTAMIMMGDPRFLANMTFDVGNSTNDGIFPRPANQSCEKYTSKIKSYCDTGDPFCARGNQLTVHIGYVKEYGDAALNFTNERIKAGPSSSGSLSSGAWALSAPVKTASIVVPLALLFAAL